MTEVRNRRIIEVREILIESDPNHRFRGYVYGTLKTHLRVPLKELGPWKRLDLYLKFTTW